MSDIAVNKKLKSGTSFKDVIPGNKLFIKGNEAAVFGALLAGCDSYFGYPITPASEIAHTAAKYFPMLGKTFLQAESELSAINMVYGAAACGERTMTASSGPGISLKSEGISYLAACELPCLIVDIMRAGPGLGNIGPEQSDYNQLTKGGGHGDYNCIVLAPNSVQEMLDFAVRGFELADLYRIPVFVAADGVIGQMMEPVVFPDVNIEKPDKPWALTGDKRSENIIHTSIYLDFDELETHNNNLQRKFNRIKENEQFAEEYLTEDAEVILIGYGIISRQLKSLVNHARKIGIKAGLIRPVTLWPFPEKTVNKYIGKVKKLIVVEMSNGQMYSDIKLYTESKIPIKLLYRLGGNLIENETVFNEIKSCLE
jgi:2-oxoisovalerate ferredoxin oxidoreductase alpha subunit